MVLLNKVIANGVHRVRQNVISSLNIMNLNIVCLEGQAPLKHSLITVFYLVNEYWRNDPCILELGQQRDIGKCKNVEETTTETEPKSLFHK